MSISQNMFDHKATTMVPIVLNLWVNNKLAWIFLDFHISHFQTALTVTGFNAFVENLVTHRLTHRNGLLTSPNRCFEGKSTKRAFKG